MFGHAGTAAARDGIAVVHARPSIVSIVAAPVEAAGSAGTIVITVRVRNATRCVFTGRGGMTTMPCASGRARATMTPAAAGAAAHRVAIYSVIASSDLGTARKTVRVAWHAALPAPVAQGGSTGEATPPAAQPQVGGLDACSPGPDCDYGPIAETFQQYGNVGSGNIGDCTFAAVADWEQIVLGAHPDPALIESEFLAAGGTPGGGLSLAALWAYWEQQGVAGFVETGLEPVGVDQADLEDTVRTSGAAIAELEFTAGSSVAQLAVPAGFHLLVVDGFTPAGPLVVSWGLTLQMTWQQWSSEAVSVFQVTAAPAP